MPFAALPSSPGFQQPQAPDWSRFAEQANELIMRGGEMRAQAGKDFANQLDKSFMQVSKIMEYNSPEEKAKRRMEMIKNQALTDLYEDYRLHKDKYTMTAHGPVLNDGFEAFAKRARLTNTLVNTEIGQNKLQRDKQAKEDEAITDIKHIKARSDASRTDLPMADEASAPPTLSKQQPPEEPEKDEDDDDTPDTGGIGFRSLGPPEDPLLNP